MHEASITPSIAVTIGREARVYHAFVTTARAHLDAPSTMTLYASSLSDVSGLAAEPITLNGEGARTPARLILVSATDLLWQRARYRGGQHLLVPADPILVGFNTLQHWLWQRLQAPVLSELQPTRNSAAPGDRLDVASLPAEGRAFPGGRP